jgi:preprotein translocase subunit SecE
MANPITFLNEVRAELQKVVWPTRKQTLQYTAAIIIFSVVMALILGAADLGLLQVFEKIIVK